VPALVPTAPPPNPLQVEVFTYLLMHFLSTHPTSPVLLARIWPLNRPLVVRSMVDVYLSDETWVTRLLDLAQELKVSPPTPALLAPPTLRRTGRSGIAEQAVL